MPVNQNCYDSVLCLHGKGPKRGRCHIKSHDPASPGGLFCHALSLLLSFTELSKLVFFSSDLMWWSLSLHLRQGLLLSRAQKVSVLCVIGNRNEIGQVNVKKFLVGLQENNCHSRRRGNSRYKTILHGTLCSLLRKVPWMGIYIAYADW